ncbi:O-methyltransferase, COMT catechol-like protein 1 [Schizosaccharomyces osmophilus]|uniref:catechol O-methyltransferase n=1 Tax=Schizosaccharomyces osmophilus TaxID=2545709 RepID=A0AAF0ATV0_9SCHI|nr:O-methyltransferase, COMT catechol-like protein 1 [Schizosaccharomyces osmophilus]WBW71012.1 O-methyltransferase, COMT catechol-like protein 1 [Schizosaccharomyces osmophilus]
MTVDYTKEQAFVDHLLSLPSEKLNAIRGKPEAVIKAIHDFEKTADTFYMDIGESKGQAIVNEIREKKPKIMVELGCYLGYSAVLFGKELLQDPAAHYYSLEVNSIFAEMASKVIDLAGLSHKVTILVGPATESLVALREHLRKEASGFHAFDFVFIDHWQKLYVPDLRVMESLELVAPGTVLVADNIYIPGAPEYAKYVQAKPDFKREYNAKVQNANGNEFVGRWDILYDSKTVPIEFSLGTDAVEITRCTGYVEK